MVKALDLGHDKAEELRRIGIREGSRISLITSHDPMLVVVENTRIALSHHLARHVKVEALAHS
jgi:Fe2+ transport system protein FeoA